LVDDHSQALFGFFCVCSFSTATSVGGRRRGTVEVDLRGRVGLGFLCFLGPDVVAGDRLKELLDVVVGLGGSLEERRLVGGDKLVDLLATHSGLSDDRAVLLEQVICMSFPEVGERRGKEVTIYFQMANFFFFFFVGEKTNTWFQRCKWSTLLRCF
jgi:hypothetical protein